MNRSAEVETWFTEPEHPLKDAIIRAREIILTAEKRLEESIKWKGPMCSFRESWQAQHSRQSTRQSDIPLRGDHPRKPFPERRSR
jgi:hypothetical protein